ncbi:MAG: imidazole glycerol phosphate synthase subunit HisH [Ruminococcaceae bacterium]|nr:imidazole glycerol phosphate synthase subunit HisH [Oscillospiraceae bacterium]
MIAVIDYGAGNLHSVKNALDALGAESIVTAVPEEIIAADKVILPGVGAFGDAMQALRASGMDKVVCDCVAQGKPLFGICLGLQLLFEESEEAPGVAGLGILKGKFVRIPNGEGLKIPHMGWNDLTFTKPSRIFAGLEAHPYVYFVHSYYLNTPTPEVVSAYTQYGVRMDIAVESGNLFATQFHPEKSGTVGMQILKNFIEL